MSMQSIRSLRSICIGCLLLAGCTSPVRERAPAAVAAVAAPTSCVPPQAPVVRPDFCSLPADVRAFVEDRDGCDHFRSEPWPEGDDEQARERRRFLIDAMRTGCAGTDKALEALLQRYRDDPAVMKVLAEFERNIERVP
jgi:hypothetical protein